MKQYLITAAACWLVAISVHSQELYVFSEPASNMPAHSIGLKTTARFPNATGKQRYTPELMFGLSKNWMVHLSGSLSDYYQQNTRWESGKVYAKYRFYSNDDIHRHFRMAAFADAAITRNPYRYMDANLDGDNNGVQAGVIATQLVNKLAVSGTASYLRVFNGNNNAQHHTDFSYHMLNYSLSAGYLLLPRNYVSYQQPNVNVYIEMLGMKAVDKPHYGLDLAPALQLIVNSNTKVNVGYRFQVAGNMERIARQQFLISAEHTLFNLW